MEKLLRKFIFYNNHYVTIECLCDVFRLQTFAKNLFPNKFQYTVYSIQDIALQQHIAHKHTANAQQRSITATVNSTQDPG